MKMAYAAPEVKEHQMIQFETAQSWNCGEGRVPPNNGNGSNFPENACNPNGGPGDGPGGPGTPPGQNR
ncbi:hypothetical protein [Jeotgalibacillus aurantiacus]|uniref:hypothetical protein n=1 Tax=Jeotgalibacillus aurantiacus TaxID=2763266 RepID=UPI001D0A1387|nr:hypothetical protein [Jeotgalibacillus aurantiacus]